MYNICKRLRAFLRISGDISQSSCEYISIAPGSVTPGAGIIFF